MATSKKAAPAKVAAKQAPAPAVEEAEEALEGTIQVGSKVTFLGYDEDVAENERILTEGEVYEVVGFTEATDEDEGGDPIVQAPNPDFNPKKKEHPETNPKHIDVQMFPDELELAPEAEEAEEEVAEAPVPAVKKKAAKKVAAVKEEQEEAEEPEEEEEAPAPAKKGKAVKTAKVEKVAPAKKVAAKKTPAAKKTAAKKVAAKKAAPVSIDEDEVPDLEFEDPQVLALVEGSEDLIATAQELDSTVATNEYQLGGLLYHIKKDKLHQAKEMPEAYREKGGWALFVQQYFHLEYRKAQWLEEIYINFSLAGIEDAAAEVAAMGWTKAKDIAKLLVEEGTNVPDLLELAKGSSASDLRESIKASVRVGEDTREVKKRVTIRLKYFEEEGRTVEAILTQAQETLGLENIGQAAAHIITEWAAEHAGGTVTKEAAPVQRVETAPAPAKKVAAKRAPAMA